MINPNRISRRALSLFQGRRRRGDDEVRDAGGRITSDSRRWWGAGARGGKQVERPRGRRIPVSNQAAGRLRTSAVTSLGWSSGRRELSR